MVSLRLRGQWVSFAQRVFVVLTVLAIIFLGVLSLRNRLPHAPQLVGYSSDVTRIDEGINLTEIMGRAGSSGYRVEYRTLLRNEAEDIHQKAEMRGPAEGSILILRYNRTVNSTHFLYRFPYGAINPKQWLSNKLGQYMRLDCSTLNAIQRSFKPYFTDGVVEGEPDWEEIRGDLGDLITNDSRDVGRVCEKYAMGEIVYATPYVNIFAEEGAITEEGFWLIMDLMVYLDADGDVLLQVNSHNRLVDPSEPFVSVFETLNLPTSVLSSIKLHEWLAILD